MPKYYVSSKAKCPFYRGEEPQVILCDGIAPNVTIRLAFGESARDYKKAFCRSGWSECPVAKMLWDLDEKS